MTYFFRSSNANNRYFIVLTWILCNNICWRIHKLNIFSVEKQATVASQLLKSAPHPSCADYLIDQRLMLYLSYWKCYSCIIFHPTMALTSQASTLLLVCPRTHCSDILFKCATCTVVVSSWEGAEFKFSQHLILFCTCPFYNSESFSYGISSYERMKSQKYNSFVNRCIIVESRLPYQAMYGLFSNMYPLVCWYLLSGMLSLLLFGSWLLLLTAVWIRNVTV